MDEQRTAVPKPTEHWNAKGFWALIVTQFQGAFNDSLFKYLVVFFLAGIGGGASTGIMARATMVFSLPFIIFPGIFGALSDRFSKQRIIVWVKFLELAIVALAVAAFLTKNPMFLWVVLFFMGAHSAFFSPSKYGILPEILPESRLSWGNGVIALGTMIAVIAGAGTAGPLYDYLGPRTYLSGLILAACTAVGLVTAYMVTRPPAANPTEPIPVNPWAGMGHYFKLIAADRWLLLTVIGYTYFWFIGLLILNNVFDFGDITLHLTKTQISVMLVYLNLGIGIGSLGAGYLSRGKIEIGLVPIGLLGLAIFAACLALPSVDYHAALWLLAGLGFSAGVFDVPLAATLQHRSPNDAKGGIMATSNMLTFLGMFAAGGLASALSPMGVGIRGIFLLAAVFSLVMGVYLCVALPTFLVRCCIWAWSNVLYRVHVRNRENVPLHGGALLVANHVSFIDPCLIMSVLDRQVHVLMYRAYYDLWWLKPFVKMAEVIPIASTDGPEALLASLRQASDAIRNGELVCVFPEGGISRTSQLMAFQKGYERIMKDVDAPIIPVHVDNVWGSIFSFYGGRFFRKWPKNIFRRITISFGAPMPPTSKPVALYNAVQELATEAYTARKLDQPLLHRAFIKAARRHPRLMAVADARTGALNYLKTLVGSIILAQKLRPLIGDEKMVGVIVPPSVGGALTNIALQIMGHIPINLNYTLSAQALDSCTRRSGITHCITSKAFLERFPMTVPGTSVFLENITPSITSRDRIIALLLAIFCPTRLLEHLLGSRGRRSQDDIATVMFSSGSEGEPKGAVLTHFQIMKNIDAMGQVFPHDRGNVTMGFLPFFHSYGFTGTMWTPLTIHMSAVFHPSPLEPKAIGELVHKYHAKFLFATCTFVQNFIRRCTAEELSSLRYIICGGEKLTARVRDAFMAKFGVEPVEGYGTTECSPVVSVNVPDIKYDGIYQMGTKLGSVGRPLPGLSVRVVDVDTGAILGENQPGLLQVKGPNVMNGYLGMPEKTASVLQDGWYSTGDIAFVDEDGFITITDRLARFSKIAGEMVPHTVIEEAFHSFLELTEQSLAVVGVKDAAKGERLIVLHTLSEEQLERLLDNMEQVNLPNLFRPRPNCFYRIDAIPCLGTGKMDIKTIKALAEKLDLQS